MTKDQLEENQIWIYLVCIAGSLLLGLNWEASTMLQHFIEPVIALLLFSMFCQIPFLELRKSFADRSFFKALLLGNFVLIPVFVWALLTLFRPEANIAIGVLLVLLTPCIDYVIVFSHLGKGDSNKMLAATPILFLLQLLLLPLFLGLFMGKEAAAMIAPKPFLQAFIGMILLPLLVALSTQALSTKTKVGNLMLQSSGWLPVPLMALTFFVVISSQISRLVQNPAPIYTVLPIYICFGVLAPLIGQLAARIFRLAPKQSRTVSFSCSTRNSLVVLPLALALPSPQNQLVAIVIVTQTIVEICFELIYIRVFPKVLR